MLRFSDLTSSLQDLLTSSVPLIVDGVTPTRVLRGDYVNVDPNKTPWLGIYRSAINYAPARLGNGCDIGWDAKPKIRLMVQSAHSRSGAECEDRLEQLVQDVLDSILHVPTWSVSDLQYSGRSVSVASGTQYSLHWSSDGMHAYALIGANVIYQYDAVTAWDVSTLSYSGKSVNVGAQDNAARGICLSIDGSQLYVSGDQFDAVYEYALGTAWDISTASYTGRSLALPSLASSVPGVQVSMSGRDLYVLGVLGSVESIHQYALATPFDLSSASYVTSIAVTTSFLSVNDMYIRPDGLKAWITTSSVVRQYTFSNAWDVSTLSYDGITVAVNAQDTSAAGISLSNNGRRLYLLGNTNDRIYEYNMTSARWSAVDNINAIDIEYSYKEVDTSTIYFQWALITLQVELGAG